MYYFVDIKKTNMRIKFTSTLEGSNKIIEENFIEINENKYSSLEIQNIVAEMMSKIQKRVKVKPTLCEEKLLTFNQIKSILNHLNIEKPKKIKIGDCVKICLVNNQERVLVKALSYKKGNIKGVIKNHLCYTKLHGYDYGSEIDFTRDNVYQSKI